MSSWGFKSSAGFFTEVQRYKVAAVVFGLICLLQLTLIIFLALSASHHKTQNEKEKSELKTINFDLQVSNKNLTEEKEQLRRNLSDFVSQRNLLIVERDGLKKTNFDFQSSLNNLTAERERLIRNISGTEANNKQLTEQRDELKKELENLSK
ncbi:hypothetical protein XENOCAPTIV_015991 [Xenoophorus captivus]|uniref:Uncharacterized protein n=1 Tax=Xenoophorus captivus TaxID=1517983 RepID=A0ABV0RQS8_9TELE